jgi:predicted XRE-type DNA-binding protein
VIDDLELVHCSGNVWRDVGYADADLRRATSVIAGRIVATLNDRGLSMRQAAKTIGFAAADYSRVRNADYGRFAIDRLVRMLQALNDEIEVAISASPHRRCYHQPEATPA